MDKLVLALLTIICFFYFLKRLSWFLMLYSIISVIPSLVAMAGITVRLEEVDRILPFYSKIFDILDLGGIALVIAVISITKRPRYLDGMVIYVSSLFVCGLNIKLASFLVSFADNQGFKGCPELILINNSYIMTALIIGFFMSIFAVFVSVIQLMKDFRNSNDDRST